MSSTKRPQGVSELTKRLLFGSATRCAFPDCPTPLVLVHGHLLSINAEVAHIRSPEPRGPRYVAGYDQVHAFENLLLLCGSHHHLVDQNPSHFPISLLEQYKVDQVAQTGQPVPQEVLAALRRQVADLSDAVESRDSDWPKSPLREVRLVSGSESEPGEFWIGPATHPPGNQIGVQPSHLGLELCHLSKRREIDSDFKVREAGFEFDMGRDQGKAIYVFENDLKGSDYDCEIWLARQDQLQASLMELIRENRAFPARFRGFMEFDTYEGVVEQFRTKWVSLLDIPSWNELIKENWDQIASSLKSME